MLGLGKGVPSLAALLSGLLAIAFAILLAGCGSGTLISATAGAPARITPNGDRIDDVATIAYTLARPAKVSVYLLDEGARRYTLRDNLARPAGDYELTFDGTVESGGQRLVVPAGQYKYVVEATDDAGQREERQGSLVVADADTTPPKIANVAANPTEISPYNPDLTSETFVSYRLAKRAWVTLYVVEPDGRRTRLSEPVLQEAGEHALRWDGLIRDKVPAAGTYTAVVQAKDDAGNTAEGSTQVTISGAEEPDATIVRVNFSPHQIVRGDVVKVEITVRNTGNVVLRTQGPDPGFTYTTKDTFASVEGGRYIDKANLWRVGVDWEGGLGAEGARYPYRWGLGKDLAPGEETTVVGYIRVLEDFPSLRLYAGLIHEKVKYQVDRVGQQLIEISY